MAIVSISELEQMLSDQKDKKKVLLIDGQMPFLKKDGRRGYFFHSKDEKVTDSSPFGLARVAGYLKKHDVPIKLVRLRDFDMLEKRGALDRLIEESDILGMHALAPSIEESFKFCAKVKKDYPSKIVIGGAEHFALDHEWILSHREITGIDACGTMQGELPMLALSLGVPLEKIGSLAYAKDGRVVKNDYFPRLNPLDGSKLLHTAEALALPNEWTPMIFPEFSKYFKYCGNTQTASGCVHACTFCTNPGFMGKEYVKTLDVAKKEIQTAVSQGIDFMFVRDTLLNADAGHLGEFIDFMKDVNESEKKLYWAAFAGVKKNKDLRQFERLADSGCLMLGVGVEDILGDRRNLGKGDSNETASDFIDEAGEHLLVRTLMIMGLPNHYEIGREEIKGKFLSYMKDHPQGIYRINFLTPMIGAEDYEKYKGVLKNDFRRDLGVFKEYDTMHSVMDPKKMYDRLGTPESKRWVKDSQDWVNLRNDIISEYFNSQEHNKFIENLKNKQSLGQKGLLYKIARDFKDITLGSI